MATQKDLYAVLGVPRTASAEEIRKAYRKLARQHHPDVNPGNRQAEERFKEISFAYDVLGDPEKRRLYDEFGHEGLQPGFDPVRAREYRRWSESGRGFADILNEMFGGAAHAPASGQDIEHPLEIDFLDALRGTQTAVTIRRPAPCAPCGGSGRQGRRACTACGGTGTVEQRERLTVKIPPGVDDGARLRVAGKGGVSPSGGPPGDLYFVVKVRPHPQLRRDGRDLTVEVPVTIGEAMLGATITVPTPTGRVQLKIPKGSQSGQRLRLRGRGVPDPKGGPPGDLYVRLMVQVPPNGGEQVREAVATLERAYPGDPRAHLAF